MWLVLLVGWLAVVARSSSAGRTGPLQRATHKSGSTAAIVVALVLIAMPAFAAGQWWGSPRTPGFDQNTVIRVAGTVSQIDLNPRSGPSTLRLDVEQEAIIVALCPPWYLTELHADLREGDHILVEGSKMMDPKGNLHVMAARVTNERTGQILELRNEAGQPRWVRGLGALGR